MAKERSNDGILSLLGGARSRAARTNASMASLAASATPAPTATPPANREVAPVDKQESLIEQVLSARFAAAPTEAREDLNALHGVLQGLSQKTVIVVFAMGKVLSHVKGQLARGEFLPWIEENCSFNRISAWSYIKVYERYKDEPRRALAELSLSEAYIEAGVKKLAAPERSEEDEIHIRGGDGLEDAFPKMDDYRRLFEQATLSGVALKHYRVIPYKDGSLYAIRPEIGPVKVCDIYVDHSIPDVAYQDALVEVQRNITIALEVFYSKMETCEASGTISAPFDSSRGAMAKRMRNVTGSGDDEPRKAAPRAGKGGKSATKKAPKGRSAKKGGAA